MTTAAVLDARSMRAWLAKWKEWMLVRRYSARTIDTTRRHVEQFAIWCDTRGLVRPEEITKPTLERYQRFLFHYGKRDGRPLSSGSGPRPPSTRVPAPQARADDHRDREGHRHARRA